MNKRQAINHLRKRIDHFMSKESIEKFSVRSTVERVDELVKILDQVSSGGGDGNFDWVKKIGFDYTMPLTKFYIDGVEQVS